MNALTVRDIIRLIREDKSDQALKLLLKMHSKDCLPLIRSKTKNLDRYEVMSILYDAFLDFSDRVRRGEYEYRDEASFLSYFKTACVNKAREFNRDRALPDFILLPEVLEMVKDDAEEAREQAKLDFFEEKRANYGIELEFEEGDQLDVLMDRVVHIFHQMSDKCKFLIVLKFFMKMSHQEIVDALRLFFEIKNESVSKTELYRCIERMKVMG